MKVQDIAFIVIFVVLILLRRPRLFLGVGIVSWLAAIPLFAKWIFFTAEHLTWYGAGFVATGLLWKLL